MLMRPISVEQLLWLDQKLAEHQKRLVSYGIAKPAS